MQAEDVEAEGTEQAEEGTEQKHESGEAFSSGSAIGGPDFGNLRFGEYILSVSGTTTRFILYKDGIDDDVKAVEYQKLKEGVVLFHHNGFKRSENNISWKRDDGFTYKGEINAETGQLTKGTCKPLSFVRKKDQKWHTLWERDLVE
jgi:hypothetical protein